MKLYGKRSVYERVRANPKTIRKILVDNDFSDTKTLNLARKNKVRVVKVHSGQFYKFAREKTRRELLPRLRNIITTPLMRCFAGRGIIGQ